MRLLDAKTLRGAVIAVPIVNPLGFLMESRYLSDRRDLNRSFPGSPRGSTASRLAHLFNTEIVSQCSVGIDLHTATDHRINLPQIRADIYDEETRRLARAFAAPFTIHARVRKGSLRDAATKQGKSVLLYEAGQAQRFDESAIKFGVEGVMRTLRKLKMIEARLPRPPATREIHLTTWVRARRGGLASIHVDLGDLVEEGEKLASISDAFATRPRSNPGSCNWLDHRANPQPAGQPGRRACTHRFGGGTRLRRAGVQRKLGSLLDLLEPATSYRAAFLGRVTAPDSIALIRLHSPGEAFGSDRATRTNSLRLRDASQVFGIREEGNIGCIKTCRLVPPRGELHVEQV